MTDKTNDDIEEVLAAFRVTALGVQPLIGGTMTSAWIVTTHGERFVLRQVRAGGAAYATARHHLLGFLASRFGKAPVPVPGPQGASVVSVKDHIFELLTYIQGEVAHTPDGFDFEDDELLVSAAELLGELHSAVREYIPPSVAHWPDAY